MSANKLCLVAFQMANTGVKIAMKNNKTELEVLKDIAANLTDLVNSDMTSVEDTIIYSKDLYDINGVIQRKTLEDIIPGNIENTKCGNCGDDLYLHESGKGKCSAFGTCQCKKFVPMSTEAMEIQYSPGDQ